MGNNTQQSEVTAGTPSPERLGSDLRRWLKQLMCAAKGHGGWRQVVCYIWECKQCGKRINMH